MNIVKITPEGIVLSGFTAKAVNVGTGDDMIQYPRGIFVGNSKWTDAELNVIGFARFEEIRFGTDKRSTGSTDTFEAGRVTRTHTLVDYVAPVVPDATPTYVAEEGDYKRTDPLDPLSDMILATPGEVLPNHDYNYVSERSRLYPSEAAITVALWEAVVELRPEAKDALEVERQAIKARFPKS